MGYTRQLGQLAYLITYDGSGNITVPAALTQGSVTSSMLKSDSSGKLVAAVAGTDFVAPAGLSAYVPTTRTITINGTAYDLSADRTWSIVSGVSSFNTRTGSITLLDTDVTGALGYTPVTNARTITINGTAYDLSANRSWTIVAGLSSFNTRTGDITLLDTDVTGALGYTPVTNARTITINGTTYDLSANRTWVVDASNVATRVIQKFTATSAQTAFTITGGYTVGMVDVFLNGIKLDNAVDFTATDGSVVTLAVAAATGDIVEVYKYGGQFIANNTLRQSTLFTATAGQTTFTVNYSVGFVDVFYNGSKLDSSEFTATNGTSIVFGTACVLNDKVEVVAYNYTVGAFTGVGGSGTANTIAKWTATGTMNNSLIYDNGTNVGIGTSSPDTKLQVAATGSIGLSVRSNTSGDAYMRLYRDSTIYAHWYADRTNSKVTFGAVENVPLTLETNATERIRIDADGVTRFKFVSDRGIRMKGATSSYSEIAGYQVFTENIRELRLTGSTLQFYTGDGSNSTGSERMRVTDGGYVGIGTSAPLSQLHVSGSTTPKITITNTNYPTTYKTILGNKPSAAGVLQLGNNGDNYIVGGSQVAGGDLRFYINATTDFIDTISGTEAMRIISSGFTKMTNSGNYLGNTAPYHEFYSSLSGNSLVITQTASTGNIYGIDHYFSGQSPNNTTSTFISMYDTVNIKAVIYSNGTFGSRTSTYSGVSDIKLKENIAPSTPKLDDLLKVNVVNYNFIDDEKKEKQLGVIAQELEEVFPNMVFESEDKETGEKHKNVKYSIFVPMLIKAIQELKVERDTDRAEIELLKSKLNN